MRRILIASMLIFVILVLTPLISSANVFVVYRGDETEIIEAENVGGDQWNTSSKGGGPFFFLLELDDNGNCVDARSVEWDKDGNNHHYEIHYVDYRIDHIHLGGPLWALVLLEPGNAAIFYGNAIQDQKWAHLYVGYAMNIELPSSEADLTAFALAHINMHYDTELSSDCNLENDFDAAFNVLIEYLELRGYVSVD